MKLSKIIAEKINNEAVPAIDFRATLRDAARIMHGDKHYSGLLVMDKDHFDPLFYKGIITVTDIVKALAQGANPDVDTVKDYMSQRLIVASENDEVDYIMNVMIRHHLSHIPVIQGKKIVALVTMADILQEENIEKDIQIHWLSDFSGSAGSEWSQVF